MSSDPRRLADYGESLRGVVRDALEQERNAEDPEAARLARIEAKLLAAVGAAPVLTTPPAAEPPAPAPPAGPAPAPALPGASSWLGGKGAGVLAALAVIGAAAFLLSRSAPSPSAPPAVPTVPTAVQAPPKTPEPDPAPSAIRTVSPSELPTAVDPAAKPSAAPPSRDPATGSASASAADTEEIALLARAHDALRGKPAESLELCRQHERKFANGHFAQEREAVAIEALVYLGRRDEAERRWSSFRARFPGSSHRVHLESLFSTSPTNPAPPER